jgi:hypothetical protein
MKIYFTLLASLLAFISTAQTIAGFENYNLAKGTWLNNASPEEGFVSGSVFLPNDYDAQFDFWSGFAISADTNTTTPGFSNQYSVIAGHGALKTQNYAVCYIYDNEFIYPIGKAIGKRMIGMYVGNTTYAYLSMRDGDGFAKKFGGESGNDPDFFMLTIKKFSGGDISDDSLNVYLADYRSPDPSKDYILSDWKYVDLTSLGEVDSLVLYLRSSDNGIFGMNTPAYVCFDEISTDNLLSASGLKASEETLVYGPNPAKGSIYLTTPEKAVYSFVNLQGEIAWSSSLDAGLHEVHLTGFASGVYIITMNGRSEGKFFVE